MASPRTRTIRRSDNYYPTGAEESQLRSIIEQEEATVNTLEQQKRERAAQLDHASQSGAALDQSLHTIRDLLAESTKIKERVTQFAIRIDHVLNMQAQVQSYLASGAPVVGVVEEIKSSLSGLLDKLDTLSSVTPSYVCQLQTELETQDAIASNAQSSLGTLEVVTKALLDGLQTKRGMFQPVHKLPSEVLELIFAFSVQSERLDIHANFPRYNHQSLPSSSSLPAVSSAAAAIWGTCRRWRVIATALPHLWSYLQFNCDIQYATTDLEYPLSLSRDHRLEVDIYAPHAPRGKKAKNSSPFLPTLPLTRLESVNFINMKVLPSNLPPAKTVRFVGRHEDVQLGRIDLPSQVLSNTSELVFFDVIPILVTPISIQTLKVHWTDRVIVSPVDFNILLQSFPTLTHLGVMCTNLPNFTEGVVGPTITLSISVLSSTPSAFSLLSTMIEVGCQMPSLTRFIVRGLPYPVAFLGLSVALINALHPVEHFELQADTNTNTDTGTNTNTDASDVLRWLLDFMPSLRTVSFTGNIVPQGIQALMVEPALRVEKLVVIGSKTDGSAIQSYAKALRNVAVEGNNPMVVSFIDCPYVPSDVRKRLGPRLSG